MSPDSTSLNTPETLTPADADAMVAETAARARAAAPALARAKPAAKTRALRSAADAVRTQAAHILAANNKDMAEAEAKGLSGSMLDRLKLDDARLESVAQGLEAVADLADPVGRIQADWTPPERPGDPADRCAFGRNWRCLRIPPKRHRRRWRTGAEGRKLRYPARRI